MNITIWLGGYKSVYSETSYDKYDYEIKDGILYLIHNGKVKNIYKEWSNISV